MYNNNKLIINKLVKQIIHTILFVHKSTLFTFCLCLYNVAHIKPIALQDIQPAM